VQIVFHRTKSALHEQREQRLAREKEQASDGSAPARDAETGGDQR
jgi:hypothetical protein